jgi:solute carrier family 25 citrate transporter 1
MVNATTTAVAARDSAALLDRRRRLVAPAAGFLSAGLEITLVWPCEYAKVQLQLNRGDAGFRVARHMWDAGFRRVYGGLAPMLLGAPLQGMLRFGALDACGALLRDPATGDAGRAGGLLAGLSAGALEALLVVTPMETVKTRLIDGGRGLVDGVRGILRAEGVAGLYKGLPATMAKSMSNQALRFVIYGEYKRAVVGGRAARELSPLEALAGGMVAGCLGAVGNTPIDTVKTRTQGLGAARYRGALHCAAALVRDEGPAALWKGLGPRLARVVPGQGIIFCSYETISAALRDRIA